VSLGYAETNAEIAAQHYAFLIGEEDFDAIFGRIAERGITHWADPGRTRPGEINQRWRPRRLLRGPGRPP
jgi:hypothetical protein